MKLSSDQIARVKQLVINEVKFNETYLEVYDHVLTALENRNEIRDIQKAYLEIIEQDFGGHRGLENLENFRKRMLSKEIKRNKWKIFLSLFKWPVLPVTLAISGYVYYLLAYQQLVAPFIFIIIASLLLPFIVLVGGNFVLGLRKSFIKRSIRDDATTGLADYMTTLCWRATLLSYAFDMAIRLIWPGIKFRLVNMPLPVTITLFFVFCVGHAIAVLQVYHKEYKMRLQP